MYGYRISGDVCPIFITYHKEDQKKRNAIYNNQLRNGQTLRWYTRSPRHLNSPEVQQLLAGVDEGRPHVRLYLFVKRSDAAGKQFYYLGPAQIQLGTVKEEQLGAKKKAAVGQLENKNTEPDTEQTDQEPEENDEPITIEQVREAFMNKNSKANTSKLKAILKKYNVAKVTDLPEESFADVLKELEEI